MQTVTLDGAYIETNIIELVLRPNVKVNIELPTNLTFKESAHLQKCIRAMAAEGEQ